MNKTGHWEIFAVTFPTCDDKPFFYISVFLSIVVHFVPLARAGYLYLPPLFGSYGSLLELAYIKNGQDIPVTGREGR
jgi:hypothetical protein